MYQNKNTDKLSVNFFDSDKIFIIIIEMENFTVKYRYTKEMSDKFLSEYKSSGECSVQNPDFYGNWKWKKFGTEEYKNSFKK